MRLLAACSLGGAGHLQPLLPFLRAAGRHDHATLVVGPPALGAMVDGAGFSFHAGAEPREDEVAPIRERLAVAPPGEAAELAGLELFGRMATAAMLPSMEEVCRRWRPDLILREPCEYASAVVAGASGIPTCQVAISLAQVEDGAISVAARAIEGFRGGVVSEIRSSPYLTRMPASLDPSPFATTLRYRDGDATPTAPGVLPAWWGGSSAPLVYVTFGTVLGSMSIARAVLHAAVDAVRDLEARVLLTTGPAFASQSLGPVPPHVHVEPWVDQDDVLGHAALVVCHGGSGTAFGALAAGVPLVCAPLFADQRENSRRVEEVGAGLAVEIGRDQRAGTGRFATEDAHRMAAAIGRVMADDTFGQAARRIADEIAGQRPAEVTLEELWVEGGQAGGTGRRSSGRRA